MSAHDSRTLRLARGLEQLMAEELEAMRLEQERRENARLADAEIMKVCAEVARASDRVEQCKFAGASEFQARRKLDAALKAMKLVMRKHGRGGV